MMRRKSRKYVKWVCSLLGILFFTYICFVWGLSLHKINNRPYKPLSLAEEDRREIIAYIATLSDEIEIIKSCNEFSCKKLSFHRRNDLANGEANCVGYAQYTATLLNYAFKYKGLSSKARPVVGQVHLYGFNLHPLATAIVPTNLKSFFKDHDFVEIKKENGDTLFIDTSLQDLIGKYFFNPHV